MAAGNGKLGHWNNYYSVVRPLSVLHSSPQRLNYPSRLLFHNYFDIIREPRFNSNVDKYASNVAERTTLSRGANRLDGASLHCCHPPPNLTFLIRRPQPLQIIIIIISIDISALLCCHVSLLLLSLTLAHLEGYYFMESSSAVSSIRLHTKQFNISIESSFNFNKTVQRYLVGETFFVCHFAKSKSAWYCCQHIYSYRVEIGRNLLKKQ